MWSAQEYAANQGYPSFAALFEPVEGSTVPLYLKFLGLPDSEESRIAILIARQAIKASPNAASEVIILLSKRDWRPHLVGCVAIWLGVVNEAVIQALWKAFEKGSWVSPQIAATALHCDPFIENRAREYVEVIRNADLSGLESYSSPNIQAPAPFTTYANFGKSITALIGLGEMIPDAAVWLEEACKHPNMRKVIELPDVDGGQIARYWFGQVDKIIVGNHGRES